MDETAAPTGYTLTLNGAFTGRGGDSSYATSSPDARFPVEFFQSDWYVAVADDDAATFTLGNLPAGATYTIEASASNGNASRPTTFSATNSTPASVQYSPGAVDPVPQPVVLTGTVPVGGEVVLSNIGSSAYAYNNGWILTIDTGPATPNVRKSSTFDIETTLGTITTATLNSVNVFDHVTGQVGTTVSFAGAATDEITTSGEYTLALGDGTGTENITVQVNVYGVAPSNNPLQKDGAALASLTGVQLRITSGANLTGSELFYSGTATTDASGNLSNIDLSSTSAADTDPVLLHMLTSAGDSIIASETVGLI